MATSVPPKKNTAFVMYVGLVAQATRPQFKANPTLAAGDFKVSIDGGALADLATLPTVTPAASRMVKISLSASEMNGDDITVICSDAAGAEWDDLMVSIKTAARWIDDLAYPATTGRSMVVDANGLVDANTVKIGPTGSGTAQTARDLGASVLLSSGTGAGQLDFTSGVVKANLAQILGTALTETAGQIAAAFKKFFDKAAPTGTVNSLPDAVAGTPLGLAIVGDTMTLTASERNAIADAYLDRAAAVDTYTPRQIMRIEAAALAGKSSGGPGTPVYRAIDDSKARITATATVDGDRTAVVVDGT